MALLSWSNWRTEIRKLYQDTSSVSQAVTDATLLTLVNDKLRLIYTVIDRRPVLVPGGSSTFGTINVGQVSSVCTAGNYREILKAWIADTFSGTIAACTTTSGSRIITTSNSFASILVGMAVSGGVGYVQTGSYVVAKISSTSIVLNIPLSGTAGAQTLTFTGGHKVGLPVEMPEEHKILAAQESDPTTGRPTKVSFTRWGVNYTGAGSVTAAGTWIARFHPIPDASTYELALEVLLEPPRLDGSSIELPDISEEVQQIAGRMAAIEAASLARLPQDFIDNMILFLPERFRAEVARKPEPVNARAREAA